MALAAAQVIDAVAALLAPLPASAGRVYTSRAWPLTLAGLPAWRVTAEEESVVPFMLSGENEHTLAISARAFAAAVDDLDDVLHTLAAGGLALIFAGTPPHALRLSGIRRELATEGEAMVGVITLRLQATFYVHPQNPETIL